MRVSKKIANIWINVYLSAKEIVKTAHVMLRTNVNVMIVLSKTSLMNALNNALWVVQMEDVT